MELSGTEPRTTDLPLMIKPVFTHTQSLDNHASVRRCRRLAAEHECELHLGVQTGALHAKGTSVDTKVV